MKDCKLLWAWVVQTVDLRSPCHVNSNLMGHFTGGRISFSELDSSTEAIINSQIECRGSRESRSKLVLTLAPRLGMG